MKNSVQTLINDIKELRGTTVKVFGQDTTLPTTTEYLLVDAIDFLEGIRGYEADLTISTLDYEEIERLEDRISELEEELESLEADEVVKADRIEIELDNLRSELEEAEDNYIEKEAESIEDYLEHLECCYGLKEVHSGNTCNQSGNITNDYYVHHFECGDGYHYVILAVHRYGDVRCNYTDEVLLRFNSHYESYEALSEGGYRSEDLEVGEETFCLDIRADYEGIEVYGEQGDHRCTIYGCFTEEEARKEIAEKLGIELEEEQASA